MQVISVPEDETRNSGLTTGSAIRTMPSLTCCCHAFEDGPLFMMSGPE